MKVAVLGASGRAGSEIVKELSARGHTVTAIARKPEGIAALPHVTAIAADADEAAAIAKTVAGHDVVVSALPFAVKAETVMAAMHQAGVSRLLVTGGAASLKDENDVRYIDRPDFPDMWRGGAQGGIDFYYALKEDPTLDWVFFSPAFNFVEGPRTGEFRLGKEHLIKDASGDSRITFADYAIAMVDEVENHAHSRERFT
ncbi:MAG: NAD(P)H-binding protein, partial [Alteraurantiacibacter sp.]